MCLMVVQVRFRILDKVHGRVLSMCICLYNALFCILYLMKPRKQITLMKLPDEMWPDWKLLPDTASH